MGRTERETTPLPLARCDDQVIDAEFLVESQVEDLVDGIVNEIAASGLPELVVVQRIAERYGHDLRELEPE